MNKTLFLQSDTPDPYALYRDRLAENAIHWDKDSDCWAVYSYDTCAQLLTHPSVLIPSSSGLAPVAPGDSSPSPHGLDEYAGRIRNQLVRLHNPPLHSYSRAATGGFFGHMKTPEWPVLLQRLLPVSSALPDIDWVEQVARRLPVTGILEGFGFDEATQQRILDAVPHLVKIMRPALSPGDAASVSQAAKTIGQCLERRLPDTAVGPVAGLLIQSYDACRGLLSNALLHACEQPGPPRDWTSFVTEVLRFDSPVHHTRRVAGEHLAIGEHTIKKGDKLVIVLAAANRDEDHFKDAVLFNKRRANNHEHLSFGAGPHACMAARFAVTMTAACLGHLFHTYKSIGLIEEALTYEPLFNIRSPQRLMIRLTR